MPIRLVTETANAQHRPRKTPIALAILNKRAVLAAYFASVTTFSSSKTTRILWLNIGAALDYHFFIGPLQFRTQGRNHRTLCGSCRSRGERGTRGPLVQQTPESKCVKEKTMGKPFHAFY